MAQSTPPPFNLFGERLAELIKKTIKSQMAQADRRDTLGPKLTEMVEQQQQTNAQLGHLVTAVSQLHERVQENTQHVRHSATRPFWKKMALEVPPVVLAVLLAFGINSWWQQRQEAQLAEEAKSDIVSETKRNLATLSKSYDENQLRMADMEEQIRVVKANPDTLLEGTGVQVFPLADAAWQTAHITGAIQNFDRDFIQDAAYVYGLQKEVRTTLFTGISAMSNISAYQPENMLPKLSAEAKVIEEYAGNSKVVIRRYREFLEKYDQPQPTSDER